MKGDGEVHLESEVYPGTTFCGKKSAGVATAVAADKLTCRVCACHAAYRDAEFATDDPDEFWEKYCELLEIRGLVAVTTKIWVSLPGTEYDDSYL